MVCLVWCPESAVQSGCASDHRYQNRFCEPDQKQHIQLATRCHCVRELRRASFIVRHREQNRHWADMGDEAPSVGLFSVGGLCLLADTRLQVRTPRIQLQMKPGSLIASSRYYTLTTMTTVGYGDITPEAWLTKLLACTVVTIMF